MQNGIVESEMTPLEGVYRCVCKLVGSEGAEGGFHWPIPPVKTLQITTKTIIHEREVRDVASRLKKGSNTDALHFGNKPFCQWQTNRWVNR